MKNDKIVTCNNDPRLKVWTQKKGRNYTVHAKLGKKFTSLKEAKAFAEAVFNMLDRHDFLNQ